MTSPIATTIGAPQMSQIATENALPVTGNASRQDGQTVLSSMDTLFGSMLEDRSACFVGGGSISLNSAGTTLTFSDRLDFVYNNAGTQETITGIVAASGTLTFSATGDLAYIVLTKGTPGSFTINSNVTSIPAASVDQEVFLLAIRRDDLSPATERVYLYNGLSLTANQTLPPGVPSSTTFADNSFEVYNSSDTTKGLELSLGGNTTGKVLTISTAQTNTETLAIPNVGSGDSFVTNATTATLTNKSISGSTNTITNVSLSTGVTGTLSAANGSVGSQGTWWTATFTTPSTSTTSTVYEYICVGPGGGGGGSSGGGGVAGGGGAGGVALGTFYGVAPSTTVTITTGTGGAGGVSNSSNGATSGASSIVVIGIITITANSGTGAISATTGAVAGGAGGTATNGTINFTGGHGLAGISSTTLSGAGGSNMFGQGGIPADAFLFGNGGNASGAGGGGGGGLGATANGGNGSDGLVIVKQLTP